MNATKVTKVKGEQAPVVRRLMKEKKDAKSRGLEEVEWWCEVEDGCKASESRDTGAQCWPKFRGYGHAVGSVAALRVCVGEAKWRKTTRKRVPRFRCPRLPIARLRSVVVFVVQTATKAETWIGPQCAQASLLRRACLNCSSFWRVSIARRHIARVNAPNIQGYSGVCCHDSRLRQCAPRNAPSIPPALQDGERYFPRLIDGTPLRTNSDTRRNRLAFQQQLQWCSCQ